jgi:transposase
MISKKTHADLTHGWNDHTRALSRPSPTAIKDNAAISAATTTSWCNTRTEDQIAKLKLVKRQMSGPARLLKLA